MMTTTDDRKATEMEAVFVFRTDDVWKRLKACQSRCRVRKLDEEDIFAFLTEAMRMVDFCAWHDLPTSYLWARLDGGAVPNNYNHGYGGDSSFVSIEGLSVDVGRKKISCAGGRDGESKVCLRVPADDEDTKAKLRKLGWKGPGGYWSPTE